MKLQTHLGLLSGLDDDAIGGVVQFPRDDAEELSLVLVAVVIRGADAYELVRENRQDTLTDGRTCGKFLCVSL